tara:strand:+ start:1403 stop:1576 length:174 start_codon:yes stop_codon:yes gene_type:complete
MVKVMKKILKNTFLVATGLNLAMMGLAIYLSDLELLLIAGPSAVLTLFGAVFVFSED